MVLAISPKFPSLRWLCTCSRHVVAASIPQVHSHDFLNPLGWQCSGQWVCLIAWTVAISLRERVKILHQNSCTLPLGRPDGRDIDEVQRWLMLATRNSAAPHWIERHASSGNCMPFVYGGKLHRMHLQAHNASEASGGCVWSVQGRVSHRNCRGYVA
jgi:hypothetical protein